VTDTDAVAPVPFIVGCIRSGTTLLRSMLGSHPDLAIPPEARFISHLHRVHGHGAVDVERFVTDLYRDDRFELWQLDEAAVRDALRAAAPLDFSGAIRCVYRCYAATVGKPRYGNKTPRYVRDIPLLHAVLPEARFVHLVRDGRDVARAIADAPFGPSTLSTAAMLWDHDVRAGIDAGRALPDGWYHQVRYEDLVADPRRVMTALCEAMALPFDEAVLDPSEESRRAAGAVRHPDAHVNVQRPLTAGLRDWRVDLADHDVALVEALAWRALDAAGYERRHAPLPLGARARALECRASISVRRAGTSVRRRAGLARARLAGR